MERNRGNEAREMVFAGARDLFPTMLILASRKTENLGQRPIFSKENMALSPFSVMAAPLRRHGPRKNLQCAPPEDASPFVNITSGHQ